MIHFLTTMGIAFAIFIILMIIIHTIALCYELKTGKIILINSKFQDLLYLVLALISMFTSCLIMLFNT